MSIPHSIRETYMNKNFKIILAAFVLILTSPSHAQIEDVLKRLNLYALAYPQEKVFLHTDRATYGNGETVWFQAYVTLSPLGTFSELSNTLYVQLIDTNDGVISQHKVLAEKGAGEGHIELPLSLETGTYQIVAFTSWMRNFGEDGYFRKEIEVLSGDGGIRPSPSTAEGNIDLQFLAESGTFIEGIPTKIAFKAVNQNGLPVAVKGKIVDSNDQVVTSFEAEHDGMGVFLMTSNGDGPFYATIEEHDTTYKLPQTNSSGAHIRVNYLQESVKVNVLQRGYDNTEGNFHLLVHKNGFLSLALQMKASKSITSFNLENEKLDRGVNSLTLLDSDLNPIAERLIFVSKDGEVFESMIDKSEIGTRSKASIKLNFDLPDTVGAILSLSAVDIDQTFEDKSERNIMSELLLSSELSGNIYKPAYYFENANRKELIDLLMLTHGWRSFNYQDIAAGDFPNISFTPEKGVTISGKSFKIGKKEKPAKNADLVLIRQDDELPVILDTKADGDGNFKFREAIIFEDDSLIIRGSREKNGKSNLRLAFDTTYEVYPNEFKSLLKSQHQVSSKEETFVSLKEERRQIDEAYGFLLDSSATQLDDVVVEGYAEPKTRPDSVLLKTAIGNGDAAQDFNDPMYSGSYNTVFDALIGKIPGVQISPGGGVQIRQAGQINSVEPFFLLNDAPVDKALIESLTVQQLDRVVVFKSLAKTNIYGSQAAGGIIAFYTKKGADVGMKKKDRSKVSISQFLNGYQAIKEFYAPEYEIAIPEHIIPDRRVLLHWQPMIQVMGTTETTIDFWSSDLEGTIAIEIHGLTTEGVPFYSYGTIEVIDEN
jgi:hypothetical protein